jgi:hypothetical protein
MKIRRREVKESIETFWPQLVEGAPSCFQTGILNVGIHNAIIVKCEDQEGKLNDGPEAFVKWFRDLFYLKVKKVISLVHAVCTTKHRFGGEIFKKCGSSK